MPWRQIGTLETAVRAVAATEMTNVGVLVDALHLARSGGSPGDLIRLPPSMIRSVQLCDAHAERPEDPAALIAEARGGGSGEADGEATLFFSASLCFNVDAQHPMLRMMPELMWVHEMAVAEPAIPALLTTMACELALDRVGAGGILTRLADVVAAALIRSWVERGCGTATGWVAAARDPDIGRVLAAIHLSPSENWTVDALARVMHASRSAFAERFASVVGETPARYVLQVQMHQARQWLERDRMRISAVARRLGYDSEASFSRAFKRVIGKPPSHFRNTEPPIRATRPVDASPAGSASGRLADHSPPSVQRDDHEHPPAID